MNGVIPWTAPAVVAVKRRGDSMYHPIVAGLTLNAALEYATDPDMPVTTKVRILINWDGTEVRIEGRRIWQLATNTNRPPLPPE